MYFLSFYLIYLHRVVRSNTRTDSSGQIIRLTTNDFTLFITRNPNLLTIKRTFLPAGMYINKHLNVRGLLAFKSVWG